MYLFKVTKSVFNIQKVHLKKKKKKKTYLVNKLKTFLRV